MGDEARKAEMSRWRVAHRVRRGWERSPLVRRGGGGEGEGEGEEGEE